MIEATIRQYRVLSVLKHCGMSMHSAVYTTFLLSKGLNLFEVNLVNVAFFLTLFVCEVPTGAFADVFGRKKSFLVSCVLFAIGMFVYGISEVFWQFIIAEMLVAVAATFMSGAFDAWLVDKLRHHGYEGQLNSIFAKNAQWVTFLGLLSAFGGAFLYEYNPALPWFVGGLFFVVAGSMAAAVMQEEYFVHKKVSWAEGAQALRDVFVSSVQYGVRNKNIRFVMLLVLGLSFCVMAPNMQWQPFFKEWLPQQTSMGFIWTGMALSMMLGAWAAPKLLRHISERNSLLLCQVVAGVGIVGTVSTGLLAPSVVIFFAHEIGRGAFGPIKTAYLHDNIPSKERATVVSFESIAHHLGGAAGLVVSGALAEYVSIPIAWMVSGGMLLMVAAILSKNKNQN